MYPYMKQPTDYEAERKNNERIFKDILKKVRPELFVLMDLIDKTGLNPLILWKIMRHLNNIALGNKYGKVIVQIENGKVTFIYGEEADRINESILIHEPILEE